MVYKIFCATNSWEIQLNKNEPYLDQGFKESRMDPAKYTKFCTDIQPFKRIICAQF